MNRLPRISALVALLAVSCASSAQTRPHIPPDVQPLPGSTSTITVSGLCLTPISADSWSLGGGNGGTYANPKTGWFMDLTFAQPMDYCMPKAFLSSVNGMHFTSLVLTETDSSGTPITVVQLTGAQISSWRLSVSASAYPSETVSFTYQKIAITDSRSGAKVCWDLVNKVSC